MTVESLKHVMTLKQNDLKSKCPYSKILAGCALMLLCSLIILLVIVEVWNSMKTDHFQNELNHLKNELEQIKHRIGYEMFADLNEFETEYDKTGKPELMAKSLGDERSDEDRETDQEIAVIENKSDEYRDISYDYGEDENIGDVYRQTRSAILQTESHSFDDSEGSGIPHNLVESKTNEAHKFTSIINGMLSSSANVDNNPKKYLSPLRKQLPSSVSIDNNAEFVSLDHQPHKYVSRHWNRADKVQVLKGDLEQGKYRNGQFSLTKQSDEIIRTTRDGKGRNTHYMRNRIIGAHFDGDSSGYIEGYHEHFAGNGKLRNSQSVYKDWTPSQWFTNLSMDRFFSLNNGVVNISGAGLYNIYAQIFYLDDHDLNGYVIELNRQPLFQCTTFAHSTQRVTKSNTCHTGGITYLQSGDQIQIKDLGLHRYSIIERAKSFFGLYRIGDVRQPNIDN